MTEWYNCLCLVDAALSLRGEGGYKRTERTCRRVRFTYVIQLCKVFIPMELSLLHVHVIQNKYREQ